MAVSLETTPNAVPGAQIAVLGHYLPKRVITSEQVGERLGLGPAWVEARTGIQERRVAETNETVVDMAAAAALDALANFAADPRYQSGTARVDTVIVATSTAESTMPSVAAQVAARAGLDHPAAFDINAACAGFCISLAVADAMIRSSTSRGVLVVGCDKTTAWLDWDDRDTAVLFADGAGAAIVLPHDQRAIGPVLWGSIGERGELIEIDPRQRVIRQNGSAVYRWARGLAGLASEVCHRAGVAPEELAAFVPHQANLRIIKSLAKDLGLKKTVVATDIVDVGNTVAATIPLALSRMRSRGGLSAGGDVLLFGYGAGLSYAGQIVTLPPMKASVPTAETQIPAEEGDR